MKNTYLWIALLFNPINSNATSSNLGHIQDGLRGETVMRLYRCGFSVQLKLIVSINI